MTRDRTHLARRARVTATTPRSPTRSRRSGRTAGTPTTPSGRPTRAATSRGGFAEVANRRKLYVLDMFPYPSGAGLHVGHPLGYIGTDVYARFMRMQRPQRAARHGLRRVRAPRRAVRGADRAAPPGHHRGEHRQHAPPAAGARASATTRAAASPPPTSPTTAGRSGSSCRSSTPGTTTTPTAPARSPSCSTSSRPAPASPDSDANPDALPWRELDAATRRAVVDSYRLAYLDEAPVNWCPALGTVLANEEVTADGRSERGNHPVFRRPLEAVDAAHHRVRRPAARRPRPARLARVDQAHAAQLDRPQRRRRGRVPGRGARRTSTSTCSPRGPTRCSAPRTWCSRPSTRSSTTIVPDQWPQDSPFEWRGIFGLDKFPTEAVASYREFAAQKTELERQAEGKEKTGVFTGAFANNPTNGWNIPIFIADYVLMGYGTGAIMAVPAHDQRDFEFAARVRPARSSAWCGRPTPGSRSAALARRHARRRSGPRRTSATASAWRRATTRCRSTGSPSPTPRTASSGGSRRPAPARPRSPTSCATGCSAGSATGASRSRSSTTTTASPLALPESMLPVELPEITDFEPRILADDDTALPEPPLARADGLGARRARPRRRPAALPPRDQHDAAVGGLVLVLPALPRPDERRTRSSTPRSSGTGCGRRRARDGGVDLYVGGVEHAVLHLLYARFWHKVLFDLGHVSTPEPFHRLFNQGNITGARVHRRARRRTSRRPRSTSATARGSTTAPRSSREDGKMGKSLKNAVAPDDIYRDYGADTLRLYEMFMGPLDASRPWSTPTSSACTGSCSGSGATWSTRTPASSTCTDAPADDETRRLLHRTIAAVGDDMAALEFNTAIAALIELNNRLTQVVRSRGARRARWCEPLVLMLAPLAPARRRGAVGAARPRRRRSRTSRLPRRRSRAARRRRRSRSRCRSTARCGRGSRSPPAPSEAEHEAAARADAKVAELLAGATVRKVVVVPGRMVNFVVG